MSYWSRTSIPLLTEASGEDITLKKVFDIADVNVPESEYPKAQSYEQKRLLEALVDDSPVPIRRTEKALGDRLAVYDPEQKAVFFKSGMGFDQIFPALAQALSHAQMAMEAERAPGERA